MGGKPVKLTFDLRYPDHAKAYAILKNQKQTTQFVVNLILGGAAPAAGNEAAVMSESNPQVTEKLPPSNPQVTATIPGTVLKDIPIDILSFLEYETG